MNIHFLKALLLVLLFPLIAGCNNHPSTSHTMIKETYANPGVLDTATFGAGCFWCTEAVYEQLNGVISVTPGYSGGTTANPTYRDVCSGLTGHAEVAQIIYDTTKISFSELLEVFWTAHDPTTLNRQGGDRGTQYRSVIFYHNENQHSLATEYKNKLNKEKAFPDPVITEISPLKIFYKAEDYHMAYYDKNGNAPYCQMVIDPKVDKIRKVFKDKLKK
ncbi:MAG: peptide-methionine (S)-S-oxide reductase MsrA [Bacteroidetes bacterium]|nr:peptide-methionine (S)-S-oxide reductase MsrA [Bacteroidota bacterium]